jgi:hypothetical protein
MTDVCYYDGCIDYCTNYNNYCQVYRDVRECEEYISIITLRKFIAKEKVISSSASNK